MLFTHSLKRLFTTCRVFPSQGSRSATGSIAGLPVWCARLVSGFCRLRASGCYKGQQYKSNTIISKPSVANVNYTGVRAGFNSIYLQENALAIATLIWARKKCCGAQVHNNAPKLQSDGRRRVSTKRLQTRQCRKSFQIRRVFPVPVRGKFNSKMISLHFSRAFLPGCLVKMF